MNEPVPKPPAVPPGHGLFGWLGRQVAHVRTALKADVSASKTIYRNSTVEEKPLPQDPNVKLRRTVIDEVVVDRNPPASADNNIP